MPKKFKEEWKIYKNVFDQFTERTLFKLMSQKVINELNSPVQIGKEANVFSTTTPAGKKAIVKIYRLQSCNFNKMFDYIKQDIRFLHLKKQRREIIFAWVQREYRNLLKAREIGVNVPMPLAYLNNIIILEYIGDDIIAPMLKDHHPKNPPKFFNQLIKNYKLLYKKAGLVHADMSEFNILNYKEKPYLIDFSQTTPVKSSNAQELLKRDVKNICRFFKKVGLEKDQDKVIEIIKS